MRANGCNTRCHGRDRTAAGKPEDRDTDDDSGLSERPLVGAHAQHQDNEHRFVYLVDHSVVVGSNAPFTSAADEQLGGRRTRIGGEQFDRRLQPPTRSRVELPQLAGCHRRQSDRVRHTSPRSALTCSHGIGSAPVASSSARASAAARMSDMSSANSISLSRSSVSMTAAMRRPVGVLQVAENSGVVIDDGRITVHGPSDVALRHRSQVSWFSAGHHDWPFAS